MTYGFEEEMRQALVVAQREVLELHARAERAAAEVERLTARALSVEPELMARAEKAEAMVERLRQFQADVCQEVILVTRDEISHTDFVNDVVALVDETCGEAHRPNEALQKKDET